MSEISSPVWIIVGLFIGITSLFLGFITPVDTNAFFKLMLFVGLGMILYGGIKIRLKTSKKPEQIMQERRQQRAQERGPYQVDIDIDDYRRNPQLKQQAIERQPKYHPRYQPSNQQTSQQKVGKNDVAKYCSQCGSPLLKEHKNCPICGARV